MRADCLASSAFIASSGSTPARASFPCATISITLAACAPPMTAVRAVGHAKMKSGDSARLAIA